jgi:outer membrane lipoprotein-sorting protein
MKRRTLLSVLPLLLAPSVPALVTLGRPALAAERHFVPTERDRADLSRIETYLNALRALKARFLQVAPDGAVSGGVVWLERPGRMRFQYDPPSPILLVAGHGVVLFHDRQLNQTSNVLISQTPLGILLADKIAFSGDIELLDVQRLPGEILVSLRRTASPGDGILTLTFVDAPLALRQWSVLDQQRQETRVTLFNVELGGTFDEKLFDVAAPPLSGGGGG